MNLFGWVARKKISPDHYNVRINKIFQLKRKVNLKNSNTVGLIHTTSRRKYYTVKFSLASCDLANANGFAVLLPDNACMMVDGNFAN